MPYSNKVKVYTDGSCLGNPGPGGWACVVIESGKVSQFSGGAVNTTNNRMELMAVINALTYLKEPSSVTLYSDSQYVIRAFKEGWLEKWQRNGWNNTTGEVKNKDLWKLLYILAGKHEIEWNWVKGHAGDKYNEICDTLAVTAARHYQKNGDTPLHVPAPEEDEDGEATETVSQPDTKEPEKADEVPETEQPPLEEPEEKSPQVEETPAGETAMEPEPEEEPEDFSYVDTDMDESLLLQGLPQEETLEESESKVETVMKGFEAFIRKYNKETTEIEFPCGNFDWCEHCRDQGPVDGKCNCAEAYLTFLKSKDD